MPARCRRSIAIAAATALLGLLPMPATGQSAAPGAAEPRLALVIGNGAYRQQPLRNAANDARAVASSLRNLGFTVTQRIDATRADMEAAILGFGEKLKRGGIGLFYYAGHGIQTRGQNYLIPIDAALTSEGSVRVQGLEASLVLDLMSDARNRANLVILDACRNNPFLAVRGSRGLAAIDAARGTLIAYSTAPGQVAADGEGENSPYTAALVRSLAEPGLKAEDLFKRVRREVSEVTSGAQVPWESSSLTGDLIINQSMAMPALQQLPPSSQVPSSGREAVDIAFWNSVQGSNDPQDFRDYLSAFPNGSFAALARRRLADAERRRRAETDKRPVEAPPKPPPAVVAVAPPPLALPVSPQVAPSPPQVAAASPRAVSFDGRWTGNASGWSVDLTVSGARVSGQARCPGQQLTLLGDVAADGRVSGRGFFSYDGTLNIGGTLPTISFVSVPSHVCGGNGANVALRREGEAGR